MAPVFAYHERTKHYPGRFARSPAFMDWATQPNPFRRFQGAPRLPLDLVPVGDQPRYQPAFVPGSIPPARLGRASVSQLLQDSLALSAWKEAGEARWSLRVNPSSGNLHPTEGYLIAGPIEGLHAKAAVYHSMRPTSTRLKDAQTCPTRPGPPWLASYLQESCSSD
jgi:hypothetical protein